VTNAINAVRGGHYEAKQSVFLWGGTTLGYPTSGAVDDYAYSRHFADCTKRKVYDFTLEFGYWSRSWPRSTQGSSSSAPQRRPRGSRRGSSHGGTYGPGRSGTRWRGASNPSFVRSSRVSSARVGSRADGRERRRALAQAGQHEQAITVARSITSPDGLARALVAVAGALAARGDAIQAHHVASAAYAVGRWVAVLGLVLSLEPLAVRALADL
jgi:hypothetical protein